MKIVTGEQMIELDRRTIEDFKIPEQQLIRRAGKAVADWLQPRFSKKESKFIILFGKGNNGADGKVAALFLKKMGFRVGILPAWEVDTLKRLKKEIEGTHRVIIIDAIFGTGLNRPVAEPYLSLIQAVNSLHSPTVVSLDIPSGIHASSGDVLGAAIVAHHTLTFGLPKLGLVQENIVDWVGKIEVLDIGFPDELVANIDTTYDAIELKDFAQFMCPRKPSCYKNQLGHVLVLGGSGGFAGAPVLAAKAALRSGAGLVSLGVPKSIYPIAATMAGPEVMTFSIEDDGKGYLLGSLEKLASKLTAASSLVIGPGMGRASESKPWLKEILKKYAVPTILDADALNLISEDFSILESSHRNIILTPHTGEMARLINNSSSVVQKNRFESVRNLSAQWKVAVILKGARSIVAHSEILSPSNDRKFRFSVNAFAGNPGMAIGGSGDVLAGILGALLARKIPLNEAARMGVLIHAMAGDLALRDTGGDSVLKMVDALPDVFSGQKRSNYTNSS